MWPMVCRKLRKFRLIRKLRETSIDMEQKTPEPEIRAARKRRQSTALGEMGQEI